MCIRRCSGTSQRTRFGLSTPTRLSTVTGLLPDLGGTVAVTIPARHRARRLAGVQVHRSRHLPERVRRTPSPARTALPETVADLVDAAARPDEVGALISAAVSGRFCTSDALGRAFARRPTMRHRLAAIELVADAGQGADSPLEQRFLRLVERAHALPVAARQVQVGSARVDVLYQSQRVRDELDGRRFHGDHLAVFRDMRRDNVAALAGDVTLRFGWHDVVDRPCEVAALVASVLQARGWKGGPRRCRRTASCVHLPVP